MAKIIGLAGISGVGKTSLIQELKKSLEINRISSTKILMEALGIINDNKKEEVKSEHYLKLEKVSMSEKFGAMYSTQFKELLESNIKKNTINVYEIHFVSPNKVGRTVDYQSYIYDKWYSTIFDGVIYLSAAVEEIVERKRKDKNDLTRDRGEITMNEISTRVQKEISDLLWDEFKKLLITKNVPTLYLSNKGGELANITRIVRKWIDKI